MKTKYFLNALATFLVAGAFSSINASIFEKSIPLTDDEYDYFILGKSFFRIPWVEAPSATTARDGLGPLFNANTCTTCHPGNGRGYGRKANGQLDRSILIKLGAKSKKDQSEELYKYGTLADKVYGRQLQTSGVFDVKPEAKPHVSNLEYKVTYPDGKVVTLQKPQVSFSELNYGALQEDTSISLRFAGALVGMGLIDRINEEDILSYEDEFDKNNDGISGKANMVYSWQYDKIMLGKFNFKASAPSVLEQSAMAFHDDMGITSFLYPNETCTKYQKDCLNAPKGSSEFDIPTFRLEAVNFYVSSLAVPEQKITQKNGEKLFHQIGCTSCHRPSFTLDDKTKIHPYSDFLLHDLGSGLADGRSDFKASGSEWRTQPLWGLKYAKKVLKKEPRYLHDARARSLEEAILWHDGEALRAKLAFMALHVNQRDELIKFLKEL